MKRITINESQYSVLFEGITDLTYHFCSIESFYQMLKDGYIALTMSSNGADAYHKTKMFYLSTQRSKSIRFGYARNSKSKCRIEMDGYKLKSDGYEGMPLDYWGGFMGKQSDIGPDASRVRTMFGQNFVADTEEKRQAILDMQSQASNFEFEDRIFSDKPYISLKYIKRVDCLIDEITPFYKKLLELSKDSNIDLYFYGNEKDFTLQTQNNVNKEVIMSNGEFEKDVDEADEERAEWILSDLTSGLLALIFYKEPHYTDNDYNRIKSKAVDILNKFGLEKFYDEVIKTLFHKMVDVKSECSRLNKLRKLNTDSFTKSKTSNKIMLLGQYVLRLYGVNNFGALERILNNGEKKKEQPRNIVESVKCVIMSYQLDWKNDYDIYNGEKNSFWRFVDKDYFYNAISRQLDDDEWNAAQYGEAPIITHRSKNNESFKKYIQHIIRNDNLSLYDGAVIFYKIFGGNTEKMEELFGCILIPIVINKENYFKYREKLIRGMNYDFEEKLFKDHQEFVEYYNRFMNR